MSNQQKIDQDDAERFRFIAASERTVAATGSAVQVIHEGVWYYAYFKKPPRGEPKVIHPSPLEALRAAVDEIRFKK